MNAPPKQARKPRLSGAARSQEIVTEAVRFFAELGFAGDTRQLARRLGVTQSLIYKHFPTKDALIERVYQEVYLGRWDPYWEAILRDRSIPLEERLIRHYQDYAKAALTWDWVRIFMFSGLRGEDINRKYLDLLRQRVLEPIVIELRTELGLPGIDQAPISTAEIELVWSINARVFYFGQRQWIFSVPVQEPINDMIALTVRHFMAGARQIWPGLLQEHPRPDPITTAT